MLRRSISFWLLAAATSPLLGPGITFGQDSGLDDPFLAAQPDDPSGVVPVDYEDARTETTGSAAYDSGMSGPAGTAEPNLYKEWSPTREVSVETSHPSLFPDGRSPGPLPTYPDGTVPTQYPLDDDAYRGLPDAYPGPSMPPSWAPPVVPGQAPYPCEGPDCAPRPIGWKSAKASLTGVFGSGDSLGITTFDVRGTLEFGRLPGVFVTPQFGAHFLSGPDSTDLPSQLHDVSLDLSLYRPVGDAWLLNFALTPSLFTDGENLTSDAVRILGRFMAYYTASPTLQWAGGVVYLDRQDLPALPAFGVILTPRDDLRYELMFPKPRLAWRQYFTPLYEQWVYVTGELGGQSWAVERSGGANDIATYRDLRLVLGLERKRTSGRMLFVEGGYVFGREVEYESNVGKLSPNDTAFLRVGGAF
jgi:hypothetical protein